jgi:Mg/Co/Ni transporter MgtE
MNDYAKNCMLYAIGGGALLGFILGLAYGARRASFDQSSQSLTKMFDVAVIIGGHSLIGLAIGSIAGLFFPFTLSIGAVSLCVVLWATAKRYERNA